MAIDWGKIKRLLVKTEELSPEDAAELNAAFVPGVPAPPTAGTMPTKASDDVNTLKALLEKSTQETEGLKQLLLDEKADKDRRAVEMREQLKKDLDKKKQEVLEKLVKSSLLAPADEESKRNWEALLEANFESTSKLIEKQIEATRKTAGNPATEPTQVQADQPKTLDIGELKSRAVSAFKVVK